MPRGAPRASHQSNQAGRASHQAARVAGWCGCARVQLVAAQVSRPARHDSRADQPRLRAVAPASVDGRMDGLKQSPDNVLDVRNACFSAGTKSGQVQILRSMPYPSGMWTICIL